MLNRLVRKIKGEGYVIDKRIPVTCFMRLLFSRSLSLIWGCIRLRTHKVVFVHPTSVLKCPSKINHGKGLSVGRNCYIDALSELGLECGNNVSVGDNTYIELTGSLRYLGKGMRIGNNVGLGTHGRYGSGMGFVEIGDDTIFGNYVSIHPENHNFSDMNTSIRLQGVNGVGVKIGRDCWIGAKVTILDGTILGDGCVVAAGAVVRGEFPNNSVIGGVPAKILKMRK